MDLSSVKKWGVFFIGILCAIIIADALANTIVTATGITGVARFLIDFVLYAILFFGILYVFEKTFHIDFFGFRNR
jgi:uncharacterized membrane protein